MITLPSFQGVFSPPGQYFSQYEYSSQEFFMATGISDPTIMNAIDVLVRDLKNNSIWSKLKAIYPFVGGSASTHKYNLKDPRDLDAAYRLTFSGGWTHGNDGVTPNGSTGYANTYFNPSSAMTSSLGCMGIYNRTSTAAGTKVDMGCLSNSNRYLQIYSYFGGTFYCQINTNNSISDNMASSTSQGWFFGSRTSSTASFIQFNGTQSDEATSAISPNANVYIGAQNNAGSAAYFADRKIQFAVLGETLTKSEATTLYNAVTTFITNLAGAPVVNAGADQAITLPTSSVTLSGNATDNGSISSYAWTKDSGGAATIVSPSSSTTVVSGLTAGTYTFRLTATDNTSISSYDTMNVLVNAAAPTGLTQTTINSWNAYVYLPSGYNPTGSTTYPTIVFFPGLGEVGTDASKLLTYGPSAYINSGGWNGEVTISGNTTKFIVISIQPSSAYPSEAQINTRLATIKTNYKVDATKLHITGPSHGGWCGKTFITGDALGGPFTYASQVKTVVDVQGVISDDNSPYPNLFDNAADAGVKYLGFEQSNDNRGIPTIVTRMNNRVSGTARMLTTSYGAGEHGYFDNYFGKTSAPYNYSIDGITQNIYEWMARQ